MEHFTRLLTWESVKLTSWKQQLDNIHYDETTDTQKKKMLRTKRGQPSSRDRPCYALRWCYVHASWYSTVLFKDMSGVLLYCSNLYCPLCCNTFDHLRSLYYTIFMCFISSFKFVLGVMFYCRIQINLVQIVIRLTILENHMLSYLGPHLLDNLDDKETERAPVKNEISFPYYFFLTH